MATQGILFTEDLIQAILRGEKTQTRRRTLKDRLDCQYGNVGDFLYIKERHYIHGKWTSSHEATDTYLKSTHVFKPIPKSPILFPGFVDFPNGTPNFVAPYGQHPLIECWSEFDVEMMIEERARLLLKITRTHAEPVQDITSTDLIAEGCKTREEFAELWDMFYGKMEGYSWAENPLVWVIDFEVVQKSGGGDCG